MTAGEPRTSGHDGPDTECSADNQAAELVEEATADLGLGMATVPLDDRLAVVEAVQADGSVTFWLIDSDAPASGRWTAGTAPHESTGPLPREWTRRVGLTCAGTTHSGRPCRNAVRTVGGLCSRHAGQGGDQ